MLDISSFGKIIWTHTLTGLERIFYDVIIIFPHENGRSYEKEGRLVCQ